MVDLICKDNTCLGIIGKTPDENYTTVFADYTVLATGGIGGLYKHSTNYRHLTGDSPCRRTEAQYQITKHRLHSDTPDHAVH